MKFFIYIFLVGWIMFCLVYVTMKTRHSFDIDGQSQAVTLEPDAEFCYIGKGYYEYIHPRPQLVGSWGWINRSCEIWYSDNYQVNVADSPEGPVDEMNPSSIYVQVTAQGIIYSGVGNFHRSVLEAVTMKGDTMFIFYDCFDPDFSVGSWTRSN